MNSVDCQTSMMKLFGEKSKRLNAANNFRKKASPQMFNEVVNTHVKLVFKHHHLAVRTRFIIPNQVLFFVLVYFPSNYKFLIVN